MGDPRHRGRSGPHLPPPARRCAVAAASSKTPLVASLRGPLRATFRHEFRLEAPLAQSVLFVTAFRSASVQLDERPLLQEPRIVEKWKVEREVRVPGPIAAGRHTLLIACENDRGPPLARLRWPDANLRSGPDWLAVLPDGETAPVQSVAAIDAPALALRFPTVREAFLALLPWILCACALGGAISWGLEARPQAFARAGWMLDPALLRWALMLVALLVGLNNLCNLELGVGRDYPDHVEYLKYVAQHHRLPEVAQASQNFQAPLFYVLAASLYELLRILGVEDPTALRVLRAISLFSGIAMIEVCYRLLRRVLPSEPAVERAGLLMAVSMPLLLYESPTVGNEPLAGLLGAAAALAALALFQSRPGERALWRFAAVGLLWGLAVLAKVSALVLAAPFALGFAGWAWSCRIPLRDALLRALAVSTAFFATCGWFFIGNLLQVWQGRDRRLGSAGRLRVVAGPRLSHPRAIHLVRRGSSPTGLCSRAGAVGRPVCRALVRRGHRRRAEPAACSDLELQLCDRSPRLGAAATLARRGSRPGARDARRTFGSRRAPRVCRAVLVLRGSGLSGVDRRPQPRGAVLQRDEDHVCAGRRTVDPGAHRAGDRAAAAHALRSRRRACLARRVDPAGRRRLLGAAFGDESVEPNEPLARSRSSLGQLLVEQAFQLWIERGARKLGAPGLRGVGLSAQEPAEQAGARGDHGDRDRVGRQAEAARARRAEHGLAVAGDQLGLDLGAGRPLASWTINHMRRVCACGLGQSAIERQAVGAHQLVRHLVGPPSVASARGAQAMRPTSAASAASASQTCRRVLLHHESPSPSGSRRPARGPRASGRPCRPPSSRPRLRGRPGPGRPPERAWHRTGCAPPPGRRGRARGARRRLGVERTLGAAARADDADEVLQPAQSGCPAPRARAAASARRPAARPRARGSWCARARPGCGAPTARRPAGDPSRARDRR